MLFRFLFLFVLSINVFSAGFPNYYYDIKNIKGQKKEFIRLLLPLIQKSNKQVRKERVFVKNFLTSAWSDSFRKLDGTSLKFLFRLYKKYKIKALFNQEEYLQKIDIVPSSLALAQGAIESGWGKSRFVKEANNIFGHWTYTGNGLVPTNRDEGKTHTIRIFNSLQSSVNAYVLNLNRNRAYEYFRLKRLKAREQNIVYNGIMASKTMINYSALKEKYIYILDSVIKRNNLLYYDRL
ncbi:MAG: glucosaminidase domain-containing protein [Campylobacteraceae bacterium]|nr:glucosaminidase domain-containing protein [Campylobacteraceae bacterium]